VGRHASATRAPGVLCAPGRSGYRGPWQYETLAREVVLDIAARQIGIDPVELRRRYDNVSPLETFEQAVAILDYEAFRAEQAQALEAGRSLGVGFSNYVEPTTPVFGIFSTEGATIRLDPSGKVNVYVAGGSSGNSLETTVVQLTADALGVDIDDVNTIQGDTALTGFGGGTGGSRSGARTWPTTRTATPCRPRSPTTCSRRRPTSPTSSTDTWRRMMGAARR
jgi:carbon-monoxide dehydrogenase large subunit